MEQLNLFTVEETPRGIGMVKCPFCETWFYRQSPSYNFHGTFDLHTLKSHHNFNVEALRAKVVILSPEEVELLNVEPTVPLICKLPQIEVLYYKKAKCGYSSMRARSTGKVSKITKEDVEV